MTSGQKQRVRRQSMSGTALLAAGLIGAVVSAVVGSIGLAAASVFCLAAALVLLYQAGKSLP